MRVAAKIHRPLAPLKTVAMIKQLTDQNTHQPENRKMQVDSFLGRYGLDRNPFAEEDAATDQVFREACIDRVRHPAWDKIFGSPSVPATSIVFGEKGAGKTALRLQIDAELKRHNSETPDHKTFVIHYDDFNPFLDRFRQRVRRRRVERVLAQWQLSDHMDAILSLGTTQLLEELDDEKIGKLDRDDRRDVLLLAACYNQSTRGNVPGQWADLRQKFRYPIWMSWLILAGCLTVASSLLVGFAIAAFYNPEGWLKPVWFVTLMLGIGAAWSPWLWRWSHCWWKARHVRKWVRTGNLDVLTLTKQLTQFRPADLVGQPLPGHDGTDERYALLRKLQSVLSKFGYKGMVILVDRLDEPHLINGKPELMKAVLWPMLDNKFLKQPGIGLKMLLPSELTRYVQKEDRDFFQRARLDKQNVIQSLEWTPEAIIDLADERMISCQAKDSVAGRLMDLFDDTVSRTRVLEIMRTLRVPRRAFKFLYAVVTEHCASHAGGEPRWQISSNILEPVFAVFQRDEAQWEA
jgi:hypothetical protein